MCLTFDTYIFIIIFNVDINNILLEAWFLYENPFSN